MPKRTNESVKDTGFGVPDVILGITRAVAAVLVGSLLVTNLSCTRSIQVPVEEFAQAQADEAAYWVLRTEDGRAFTVKKFSIVDSAVVVEELGRTETRISSLPHAIPFAEVASVEKVHYEPPRFLRRPGYLTPTTLAGAS